MGNTKKLLLIGWDAADWKVIHKLMDEEKMPHTRNLVEGGVMGNMRTLLPPLSPMLWTSVATGKRPHKHGIYGFTEPTPNNSGVQPMSINSRKCKAIWNILNQHDLQSLVVGWWPSHPAEPINGVMVSDFYCKVPKKPGDSWDLLPQTVSPAGKFEELKDLRMHPMELHPEHLEPFVPNIRDVDQKSDKRLSMAMRIVAECTSLHSAATHLIESEPWDFAAIYYDAIDHFSHGFMRYHPPQQKQVSDSDFRLYNHVVTMGYIYHDMMLGRLLEFVNDDTTVIIMSDHGFHPDHLRPTNIPTEPAGPALEHRDFGIFIANGPGIKADHIVHGAGLLDVTPTVLTIYGLPVGEDMDGQVLTDIFATEPDVKTIESWEQVDKGNDGQHPEGMVMDASESQAALDQLVALGYIDKPHDNSEVAVANCIRELDYNLARSYMDADMHAEAVPLLLNLYNENPLEFRFGIHLANCLRATGRKTDLGVLLDDLNSRWRSARKKAKSQLQEVAIVAKERKKQWLEMKKIDEQNRDNPSQPILARRNHQGKPVLFSEGEAQNIRRLRAIARGNPQTLDFLAATVATANNDFNDALQQLEKAEKTQSENPNFQYHIGTVYLGLNRYDDASRSFAKSIELDEFYPDAYMGMCRTEIEKGRYKKAVEFGKNAVGLKYHFPVAHYFLGIAKHHVGDFEGAITSLNLAIEQNPNFPESHALLSQIYSKSQPDSELSDHHRILAKTLVEENQDSETIHEPIEIRKVPQEEMDKQFPDAIKTINSDDFVLCLAQPKSDQPDIIKGRKDTDNEVIIVSGLPRSGTSMMMQMLVAAGIEPYTDAERKPDENNPKGYFEVESAKQLARMNRWVGECGGKVVKVVAPLIPYLPQQHAYRVVFMQRDISEIISSQSKMLERLKAESPNIEDVRLAEMFERQASYAIQILKHFQFPVLEVSHHDVIKDPSSVAISVAEFIGTGPNSTQQMVEVVDPTLYRERR